MKKIFLFSILISTSYALWSQDKVITQDPLAEPYLENISRTFRTDKPLQIEFRYEVYSAKENATVSDFGSIILKNNMYKLKTEDTRIYYNGKFMWIYVPESEEVYKSEPDDNNPDQLLANPFRLLGNYRDFYKYLLKGEISLNGVKYQEVDLYPVNLNAGYSMLKILCRDNGSEIYSIILKQKNGVEIRVFINEIIHDLNIGDQYFEWNEEENPDVLLIET